MQQFSIFYEDIFDAIGKMINGNPKGLGLKQIAADLWPSRNSDTARSALTRAMNPENRDINLDPEELVKIMEITGRPEDVIFCLCDRFGFERPEKKDTDSFEKEIKDGVKGLMEGVRAIQRQIGTMERLKVKK